MSVIAVHHCAQLVHFSTENSIYRFLQLALHPADILRRRAPFSVLLLYAITILDSFWNNYGSVRIAQHTRRFIDFVINELIANITNH